jgi:hypothetical protein
MTEENYDALVFHELLVGYGIQKYRYGYLRRSGKLLLLAATTLTLTIVSIATTEFFVPPRQQTSSPKLDTGAGQQPTPVVSAPQSPQRSNPSSSPLPKAGPR